MYLWSELGKTLLRVLDGDYYLDRRGCCLPSIVMAASRFEWVLRVKSQRTDARFGGVHSCSAVVPGRSVAIVSIFVVVVLRRGCRHI